VSRGQFEVFNRKMIEKDEIQRKCKNYFLQDFVKYVNLSITGWDSRKENNMVYLQEMLKDELAFTSKTNFQIKSD